MLMPSATVNALSGEIAGSHVTTTVRQLKHLSGLFEDEQAYQALDPETVVYKVQMHAKEEGKEGGLLFGTSYLYPGRVGKEYFMTKGHYHAIRNRAEYYWGIQGEGALVLMDEEGTPTVERVTAGSLHYIPGHVAHRLVNTGDGLLVAGACWPSDAGHDYGSIEKTGFSVRIKELNGEIKMEEWV